MRCSGNFTREVQIYVVSSKLLAKLQGVYLHTIYIISILIDNNSF